MRPAAAQVLFPFVWVSNFFQNVTIVGDGLESEDSVTSRAWAQAIAAWAGKVLHPATTTTSGSAAVSAAARAGVIG